MPYRLRYEAAIDFVPPGVGLGQQALVGSGAASSPGFAGGQQQTLQINSAATPASTTFLSADITALLATMTADISAQLNAAATLARIQGFATGGG
jgi:hypothetical protein